MLQAYAQYKKVQKQRELERKVRASKRECMMLKDGDPEMFQKASVKLKHNTQQLKTYCSNNDLMYMNERTSVMGYGRSEAGKVTAAYNRALKQEAERASISANDISYMSKSFRPEYEHSEPITYKTNSGKRDISVKKVVNSKFNMFTDEDATKRNKAVRYYEKCLTVVQSNLPKSVEIPTIAIVDFEKNGLEVTAIGGFDKQTGIVYLNSRFDTVDKTKAFLSKQAGLFASKSEYAPILHEIGHKYYEDTIKRLAKSKKVCYNKAQDIVDSIIAEQVKALPNDLANLISKYASNGYKQHKYTEIIAECYSAYDSNDYAKMLLDTLEGVF